VPPGGDQHQFVLGERAKVEVRAVGLASNQSDWHATALELIEHGGTVDDACAHANFRVFPAKIGQDRRQDVLAGNRAGGQCQFARHGLFLSAGQVEVRFLVKVQDARGKRMEALAGLREHDPTLPATEQRRSQHSLQRADALADGGLADRERLGRGGEAPQLSGL